MKVKKIPLPEAWELLFTLAENPSRQAGEGDHKLNYIFYIAKYPSVFDLGFLLGPVPCLGRTGRVLDGSAARSWTELFVKPCNAYIYAPKPCPGRIELEAATSPNWNTA